MWIVRLALRRPYTVATLCLVILLMGVLSVRTMRVDIFPEIDIPVVIVVWNYNGLNAQDMERRIILTSERAYSTTIGGISSIESDSITGLGIVRIYFEKGTDLGSAIAQISAVSLTASRTMPPGIQPPVILQFNASNVPVAQLTVTSKQLSEQQLYDYGLNFLRLRLFTIPGLSTPAPYGGATRQVNVDIDLTKLAAKGLSPFDVVNAMQQNDVILPAGSARMASRNYDVVLNGSPATAADFNAIPIKIIDGAPVYVGDVAHVYDGFAVQQNIVRVDGQRATYLAILRKEGASTLAVVDAMRATLPQVKAAAPQGLEIKISADQSMFVRAAIKGVLREALISAGLVSLMVLFFLGSWRSVLIVCTSIPIAILVGVVGLFIAGQTLNIMTLGGLALAIGMLVDDATVEVENIDRNRMMGKKLTVAILDGARQIAVPALAATLTICIVFFPVALLTGPAKYLFIALALSVVFSMLASYLLSRTLVPTMARLLMEKEQEELLEHHGQKERPHTAWQRFNAWRDRHFDRFRNRYSRLLEVALDRPGFVLACFGLLAVCAIALSLVVGLDFFPKVDAGLMRMHLRAPVGTRLEDTEVVVADVEQRIKKMMGDDFESVTDSIGLPTSYNLAFVQTDSSGDQDADITVALKPGRRKTDEYTQRIRREIPPAFPGSALYFQPASIVERVLDFGLPSPIDVQIAGNDADGNMKVAVRMLDRIRRVPGVVDARIKEIFDHPALNVDVDRRRAAYVGVTSRDVANSVLTSLSSSIFISPAFWLNPQNLVNYYVSVQTPIVDVRTIADLSKTPLGTPTVGLPSSAGTPSGPSTVVGGSTSMQSPLTATLGVQPVTATTVSAASYLASIASITHGSDRAMISHYNVQPVIDVECNVEGRDLGGVASDIKAIVADFRKGPLPKGSLIDVRGQSESMASSFSALGLGIILAIVLVYLLMVVLFQSWLDPLIIIVAVPGALIGILWMLVATGTTLNVESLMGAVMAVGIATSNSILLVNFANDFRVESKGSDKDGQGGGIKEVDARTAALEAGRTRLRPVLMTALAMILGMLPMALALGEGGEQNAPLGRAVIGGLLMATCVTLFVVPVVYSRLRTKLPRKQVLDRQFSQESTGAESPA
jgi:multidrug efflux pump subunit AcrB